MIVDPGHGGLNSKKPDDKWDPVTGEYLSYFFYGTAFRQYHEHKIMMQLGRRVHHYLKLTESASGWLEFEKILRQFSDQKTFERIEIDAELSRTESYDELPAGTPDVNSRYRLYDFPDKNKRIQEGRISWMNQQQPHLIVSLHMNPAGVGHKGGMAAVLAPGFKTFDMLRRIHLGEAPLSRFTNSPWNEKWLVTDSGWTQFEAARADTWVYFNGFRTNRHGTALNTDKNRGIRYNMINWTYADPPGWPKLYNPNQPGRFAAKFKDFRPEGKFWEREMAPPELWRREDGVLGYGGDNHYATDELMRFVQQGARIQVPALRKPGQIGPIEPPYVSTYSLPTLTNAIVAYLEIAFINREVDRRLVIEHREEVARSLAVGVYSLFRGLEPKKNFGPYKPRGKPVDWKRYESLPGGSYFKVVAD